MEHHGIRCSKNDNISNKIKTLKERYMFDTAIRAQSRNVCILLDTNLNVIYAMGLG